MPGRKLWATIQLDANVVNNSFRFRRDYIPVMEINPLYASGLHLPFAVASPNGAAWSVFGRELNGSFRAAACDGGRSVNAVRKLPDQQRQRSSPNSPAPAISDLECARALRRKGAKDGWGPNQLDETVCWSMRLSQGLGEGKTS
jgi:hypothetical protein